MTEQDKSNVQACIDTVVDRFRRTPNVYLTEEDVRIHLCHELFCHFGHELTTQDDDRSIELHTEVRWYGNGNLKLRSDIVIIEVSTLMVHRKIQMPSKGYEFNIPKGIIELKFRRPNGSSDNKWKEDIESDINKLEGLMPVFRDANAPTQTEFWVIALDKKSRIDPPESQRGVHFTYEYSSRCEPSGSPNHRSPSAPVVGGR